VDKITLIIPTERHIIALLFKVEYLSCPRNLHKETSMDEPTNGKATTLLLTCMDFRYPEAIAEYMEDEGLTGKYYHVILAGASLGAVLDTPPQLKPHWRDTFFDHLEIVYPPPPKPRIEQVYILDHRDCLAYRIFRGLPTNIDPISEAKAHLFEMNKLKIAIQLRHIGLRVLLGLLSRINEEEKFTVQEME
jgi:hypothetical protein